MNNLLVNPVILGIDKVVHTGVCYPMDWSVH